jgi:hypothetical protein
MQLTELFDRVEAHDKLEGISCDEEAVCIRAAGQGMATRVPLDVARVIEWEELERILLTGQFLPLIHMTRVVGYYSRVQNWNASKLGELKDRHRGNYSVGVA